MEFNFCIFSFAKLQNSTLAPRVIMFLKLEKLCNHCIFQQNVTRSGHYYPQKKHLYYIGLSSYFNFASE